MKKIKKFFRANKIPIIIFTILIVFEITQIYEGVIEVLWKYNSRMDESRLLGICKRIIKF